MKSTLEIGDLFVDDFVEDLIYAVDQKRYKSGMKYKLKAVTPGYWSTIGDNWLTAKEILAKYKPATKMDKLLYV